MEMSISHSVLVNSLEDNQNKNYYKALVESGRVEMQNVKLVRFHVRLIQAEAIPLVGVLPSFIRCAVSVVEVVVGLFCFGLSGGFCCISCDFENSYLNTFAKMQGFGYMHLKLGLFSLAESVANIGSLTLYQLYSSRVSDMDGYMAQLGNEFYESNACGVARFLRIAGESAAPSEYLN